MQQHNQSFGITHLSRRTFVGAAGAALATAALCGGLGVASATDAKKEEAGTRTVTNLDGTVIELPETVDGVAAIFGPSYEKVVAVGAEDRIICDGDFHLTGWPWSNVIYKRINEVPGIPNAHSDLNVEDLVAQGVQVVFCFPNPSQAEAINNAGMVAIPMASTGKFRDLADTLTLYAQVFNDEKALTQAEK